MNTVYGWDEPSQGAAMNDEADGEILTFDIPDEALERAAGAEQQATTWAHCTHPWYYCPWPQ
jgi:hypothetical protein